MDGDPAREPFSSEERITDPARIAGLLRGLKEEHALISVVVEGEPAVYSSAVLEVDPERGYLLLDELSPRRGHERLVQIRLLRVRARVHGIELQFSCPLREIGGASGIAYYYLPIPEMVHYRQRRTHYRVEIGSALVIPVQFECGPQTAIDGAVHDLSVGGVGAYVQESVLKRGDNVPNCIVRIPHAPPVRGALEVCFVRYEEARGKIRIGGRFLDLPPPQRKALERFVAELERQILRRRRR